MLPLMDKTEARYAEIARMMVETNDWLVPQIDYGVAFWGKPPLSTWLSALSFKLLGVNEFTARLPYFLLSLIIAIMLGKYAKRNQLSFWLPALILFTIPQFFIHAGVVSTDMALTFSVTLVMLSFWETVSGNKHRYWKYLFFIGISLGLLAKGPIIAILTFPPIFVWVWINKYFKRVWLLFPWFIGIGIIITLAFSWYYLAEKQSPGFVDYFIIGEHFKRFFDSTWRGDKYGFPKSQPFGMIWVFLFLFALPWIQMIVLKIAKNKAVIKNNPWLIFLLLWLAWTPLFFTISKSLIHPYIMPVMVPLALLVVFWWKSLKYKQGALTLTIAIILLAFGVFGYARISNKLKFYENTDKYLVERIPNESRIFYLGNKSYSGQFYSKGKLEAIQLSELRAYINQKKAFVLLIKDRDRFKIPETIMIHLDSIDGNNRKTIFRFSGNSSE